MCACVCVSGRLEAGVVDFVLSFLWQGGDLGGLRCRPLAGVEAVKSRKEAEAVSGAHGLFQVTRLIQQLLDGVVTFYGAALDHLHTGGRRVGLLSGLLIPCFLAKIIFHVLYEQLHDCFELMGFSV